MSLAAVKILKYYLKPTQQLQPSINKKRQHQMNINLRFFSLNVIY